MASAVLDHDPPPKPLDDDDDDDNDCPIEEVRLTVPTTDDPSQPCLTIRTWILGIVGCVILSFVNQFFDYRTNRISISSVCVQILALPAGRWMARTLPPTITIPLLNLPISLNPGPFTMKEHVLITIIAGSGAGGNYSVGIITIVKAFYHRSINAAAAILLTQTTQLLGFGWAGLFRKYLVDSPFMWWPANLIQVSLFRALNEEERRPKGGLSRLQFFLISLGCSFAYYIVPNYLFPAIGSISILCLIWKKSIPIQQIGSGVSGLGVGAFAVDWVTANAWLGSPMAAPPFVLFNVLAGYVILIYILMPLCYWTNIYDARRFTFLTSHLFERGGGPYDLDRILDAESFSLDVRQYESYSKIYMSTFFAISYGIGFATLTATLSHVFLFDGQYMLKLWRQARSTVSEKLLDVHGRMMKANYEAVPQWWFHVILVSVTALSIYACEGFGGALQLPYWGILLSIAMALFFTLPIGIIVATTNTAPGLNIITEMVIGYMLPGQPMANVVFKTYGYISMTQAITFLSDFKLGHYMKIPPKSMFVAQLAGAVIANACYFGTAWWLLTSVPNICETDKLPPDTPWTCPNDAVFFSASIIWGVVGPGRMFGPGSVYAGLNYFFLIGLLAPVPVYVFHRLFPEKKWIRLINVPVIFGATGMMPPARAVNYNTWFVVGFVVNYWVFKRHKEWWGRYAYVLSAALDAGTSFMAVVAFFALGNYDVYAVNWWGGVLDDYCPLAKCPTEAGAYIPHGCPQIQ